MKKLFEGITRCLAPTTRAFALLFALGAATSAWAATLSSSGYISKDSANPTAVFSGVRLSDIGTKYVLSGKMGGYWVSTKEAAGVYNASSDGTTLTVQFQKVDGGDEKYVKCVIVKFTEATVNDVNTIYAYAHATGNSTTLVLGRDFSSSTGTPSTGDNVEGYGMFDLSLTAGKKFEFKTTGTGTTYTTSGGNAAKAFWTLKVPTSSSLAENTLVKLTDVRIGSRTDSWNATYDSAYMCVTNVNNEGIYSSLVSAYVPNLKVLWGNTQCNVLQYKFPDSTPVMVNAGAASGVVFYKADKTYGTNGNDPGGCHVLQSGEYVPYALNMNPYIGNSYTWRPVQEVEVLVVATATASADSNWSALAWSNGAADWTAAGSTPVLLTVTENCTITLDSAVSLESVIFDITPGKILTLAGSNNLTAANGIVVKGGTVAMTSSLLRGTVYGNGTLEYIGVRPTTTGTDVVLTNNDWKGVVCIKNYDVANTLGSNDATKGQRQMFPQYWGSAYSKIKWNGVCGYFGGTTSNAGWILEDLTVDATTYPALKKNDGGSSAKSSAPSLEGSGEFADVSGPTERFHFADGSGFEGKITIPSSAGMNVQFGATAVDKVNRTIHVLSGATVTVASGKTWEANGGIVVNGTLVFDGTGAASGPVTTANGSTLDLSGFTGTAPAISGTLTLASGTTLKLPAGTTLPYQIASSGSGWIDNVTVQIGESAGSSVAVCLENGSIVRTATSFTTSKSTPLGALVADANYLINVTGDATITINNDVSSVGYIAFNVSSGMTLKIDESAHSLDCPYEIISDPLTIAAEKTFTAGDAVEYYQQIGSASTGNGAISTSGTTITIDNASSLSAGNYTLARWTTPQKLSSGYGYVETLDTTGLAGGLSAELFYCADRIVLHVYNTAAQAARGTIKIWPYGDSITEGYNANHSGQNYRVLLYQKLALLGYNVQSVGCYNLDDGTESEDPSGQELPAAWKWHSAKHGATAGRSDTTASSRGNLEENVDTLCAQAGNPDVVLLHIGINDIVSSDRNPTTVYASISNVISRLESNLPNSIIVVSTVLDVATAAQTGRQINGVYLPTLVDQLNEKIRNGIGAFTSGRVVLADLNDYVKSADDGIIYDGVHPDWWGYDQMAEGWLDAITDNFTADDTFNDAMLPAVASSSLGAAAKAELADYRKGFKRYAVLEADKNILPTLETTIPYTDENSDAASANLSKVAYFVEYVRTDNNAHKWVWVDMDAFGTTIGDVGLPVANHQQVVRHLHVKSNHGAIDDVAADSEGVTGFIEFSPFGYGGASGSDSGPKDYSSRYDWNDTLLDSGTYACMQVHRIISTSAKPGGQVIFAFNNWRDSSTEAEFGIGNFSQHFSRGNQTFDYTDTKAISTMNAAAYSVKRIEIWTKPTSEYQSNDLKGTASNSPAVATFSDGNSEVFTLTIPGEGLVRVDQIVLGLRTDSETEINRLTTRRLAVYSGDTLLAMSDLMNGTGEKDMTTFFANGAAKQTFTFSQDCVLTCGTGYTLKLLNASGANGAWPALLESLAGAEDYSPIVNTTIVTSWRLTQSIYASKVYAATVSADVDAFGSLSFSPSLPTDSADRANSDLLVNVTDDATLTIGDAMPTVGSIRFSIADGVTLTLADPANINAGEVVVYGPGTLAFDDSATFKTGTDLEFAGAVNVALKSGQVLTTTGDIVVGSGATLTLAPATIAGFSASLVSAASISGEIALTAPDESSDYSIVTTSTAVTLRRTTKSAFAYEAYPNGGSPSGWFSAWNNTYSDNFSETSLRVGPSATIPYVYHVSSSSHPYYDLTARSSVSFAVYADVSQMQSSKGIIACFGNSSNGLLMYRNGDWIVAARISGGSVDRSWVPGVAVANGYHLYTVTYNSSNGKVAVYRDGNVSSASDGSAEYPHFASGALNAGFQFGTTYGGSNPTGFNNGEGLAVAAMRGYDVALQPEEVATISESFPATDGKIDRNIIFDGDGKTLTVYSSVEADGVETFFGVEAGTVVIPSGETVVVSNVRNANTGSNKTGTLTVAGKLEVTAVSTAPDVVDNGGNKGIVNGWWSGSGSSIINVSGELDAPNAYLEVIYQNNAASGTLNVNGGTVKVKGLYAHSNADNKGHVTISNGGVLELGEQVDSLHVIEKSFGYGTYRVKGSGSEDGSIAFSGTDDQPTILDPYGCTLTLNGMTGNGYVTVSDTSAGKNGKVKFVGTGNTFNGFVVITDDNAANIDLTGYTGKVYLRGTAVATIGILDNFAGTVLIDQSGTYVTSSINLSAAVIHVNNAGAVLTTIAGKEGNVTVFAGECRLMVDNDTFLWNGHIFTGGVNTAGGAKLTYVHSESGSVADTPYAANEEFTSAQLAVVLADWNIVPYYKVFKGVADGDNMAGTLSVKSDWGNLPESADPAPTTGNVAFRVDDGKTLTVTIDNSPTFGEVQVVGSGKVIFTGTGTMTISSGLYIASTVTCEISPSVVFSSAGIHIQDGGKVILDVDGTSESPYAAPYVGGYGELEVPSGEFVSFTQLRNGRLTVNGTATISDTAAHLSSSLTVGATGVVDVGAGVSFYVPTLTVDGIMNMTSTSVLSDVTTLEGTGRVEYTGKRPDGSAWRTGTVDSGWRGTVAIKNWDYSESNNWTPANYGNQYSILEVDNCNVYYFDDSGTSTTLPTLKLAGDLRVNNGGSSSVNVFAALSGTGTLTIGRENVRQTVKFQDASTFGGSIVNTGFKIVIGTSAGANDTITIDSGKVMTLCDGKKLQSANIAVSGTLEVLGTGTLQGAVTLNNNSTLKFDDIGTSVSPKMLTLSSTLTFARGTVNIAFGGDATLYDGATLIDWTDNGAAPLGAFAFAGSGLSDDWILVKEATGLKLYSGVIKDANEDRAGRVSIESDGSHKATISPTGAAVTLPARITKLEVSVTPNGFGTLTAPGVAVGNVVVKYGETIITTGAYKITKNASNQLVFEINDTANASVTIDDVEIKVEPEVDTSATPMTSAAAPQFTVKTIPGLWYAVEESTSPTDGFSVNTSTIQQATTTSKQLPAATAPSSGVKYYKIAVDVSAAALTPAPSSGEEE